MIHTAAQIRKARELLGWTNLKLARSARIGFAEALKASDDQGARSLNGIQLRSIQEAFERAGVEFGVDGSVRLRRPP